MVLLCPPFHSLLFIPNVLNHDIRQACWHRAPNPCSQWVLVIWLNANTNNQLKPKKKKKRRKPPESRSFWLEPIKRSEHRGSADSGWVTLSTSKSLESSVLFPKERRGEERRGEERRGEERRYSQPTLYNTSFSAQHRFFLYNNQKVPRGQSSCCNAPAKTASIKPASKRCKRWLMQVCLSEIIWNSLLKGETPFTCRKQTGFYSDVAINRQKKSHNL